MVASRTGRGPPTIATCVRIGALRTLATYITPVHTQGDGVGRDHKPVSTQERNAFFTMGELVREEAETCMALIVYQQCITVLLLAFLFFVL